MKKKRQMYFTTCALCGSQKMKRRNAFGIGSYCSMHCVHVAEKIRGRCHNLVAELIRQGALPKPSELPCADCGATADNYDHRDYTQPINVEAVCHGCNIRRGPGVYATSPYKYLAPFGLAA